MNQEKKRENRAVLRRLIRDARPIYGWLLLASLLGMMVIACTVIAPKLLGSGIQLLYDAWAGERAAQGLTAALLPTCGLLAAVYLLQSAVNAGKMYLMNQVVSRYYTCNLRIALSDKLTRLPIRYIDKTPAGQVLDRMQEDVSNMGTSIHNVVHRGDDPQVDRQDRRHRLRDAAGKLAAGTGGSAAYAGFHLAFLPDLCQMRGLLPPDV